MLTGKARGWMADALQFSSTRFARAHIEKSLAHVSKIPLYHDFSRGEIVSLLFSVMINGSYISNYVHA